MSLELFAYHEATKHSVESLRRHPHFLDWANMPDPFRRYEGAPVVDLPADPPLDAGVADGAAFLSSLFYYSCSISASKRAPAGYRYALRVNPSSGNLHPTEFHFLARGLRGWEDGCYHYRPDTHMAERRAGGDCSAGLTASPLLVALTSIAWREAWKYRARAYRYVNHDIGHAWQAVALAAAMLGCEARARGVFADREISERLKLAEDEWPMLLLEVRGAGLPVEERAGSPVVWTGGVANRLSEEVVEYPLIERMHRAGCLESPPALDAPEPCFTDTRPYQPFAEVARRRRSALDFIGGERCISRKQLETLLECARAPLCKDWAGRFVRLYLYAHRVEGLAQGVYSQELGLLQAGDQRVAAAGLSLGQELAGNACVTFSMIAGLPRVGALHGDRGYRYVHWEAGAIGQRLYLAAEAMGFQSTGIGAFFDDRVHRYLGLAPEDGQVVYHFACGYAVRDPRLEG